MGRLDFGQTAKPKTRFSYLGHSIRGAQVRHTAAKPQKSAVKTEVRANDVKGLAAALKGAESLKRIRSISRRERKMSRFRLDEEEEEEIEVKSRGGTKKIKDLKFGELTDDFEMDEALIASDDEQREKQLSPEDTAAQFSSASQRHKTKAERMTEIISKSKRAREEHRALVASQQDLLDTANTHYAHIIDDLHILPPRNTAEYTALKPELDRLEQQTDARTPAERNADKEFDNLLTTFKNDVRIKAADRLKHSIEINAQNKLRKQQQRAAMQSATALNDPDGDDDGDDDAGQGSVDGEHEDSNQTEDDVDDHSLGSTADEESGSTTSSSESIEDGGGDEASESIEDGGAEAEQ